MVSDKEEGEAGKSRLHCKVPATSTSQTCCEKQSGPMDSRHCQQTSIKYIPSYQSLTILTAIHRLFTPGSRILGPRETLSNEMARDWTKRMEGLIKERMYQTQSHALTTYRKVNDEDTIIRGKEYKDEKIAVYIAGTPGVAGVPTLGPPGSRDSPKPQVM